MPKPSMEHKPTHDDNSSVIKCDVSSEKMDNHSHDGEEGCQFDSLSTFTDGTTQSKKQSEDAGFTQSMQGVTPLSSASSTSADVEKLALDERSARASIEQKTPKPSMKKELSKDDSSYLADRLKSLMRMNDNIHSLDFNDPNEEQSYVSLTLIESADYMATHNFASYDSIEVTGKSSHIHDLAAKTSFNGQRSTDQLPMLTSKFDITEGMASMGINAIQNNATKTLQDNDESSQDRSIDGAYDITLSASSNSDTISEYFTTESHSKLQKYPNTSMFKLDSAAAVASSQDRVVSQKGRAEEKETNKESLEGSKHVVQILFPPGNAEDDDKMIETSMGDELEMGNEKYAGGDKENFPHLSNSDASKTEAAAKIAIRLPSNGVRYSLLVNKQQRRMGSMILELLPTRIEENSVAANECKVESCPDGITGSGLMTYHDSVEDPIKQEANSKTLISATTGSALLQTGRDHVGATEKKMEEKEKSSRIPDIESNAGNDKITFSPKKIASIEEGEAYLRAWELMLQSYRQHCDTSGKIFV
jgi:hypothetical protein